MLTEPLLDHRAWTRQTVGEEESWTVPLPHDWLALAQHETQQSERNLGRIRHCPSDRHDDSQPLLATLNHGRGFLVLDRIPLDRFSLREAQLVYWFLGHKFGSPQIQDVEGTLLFDVKDKGYDVTKGARFSGTTAESSFHTDNAFGKTVPDFVGLLCLRPAVKGGHSQLISAITVHNELLKHHADLLGCLYQPFCFDRRGEFRKGESPTSQNPIFTWESSEPTIRYLHYYIQVGHQTAGRPLSEHQIKALEVMEKLLRRPEFRVEFRLQPGQILLTNNHWILHNRTAFEDSAQPEKRRHYVRLWLSRMSRPKP